MSEKNKEDSKRKKSISDYKLGEVFIAIFFFTIGYFLEYFWQDFPQALQPYHVFFSNAAYIIGAITLLQWIFIVYILYFLKPYLLKITKKISAHILIPIFVTLVVTFFIAPKIYNYIKIKDIKTEAINTLIEAVNNDPNLSVKKSAALALSKLGTKECLDAITEASIEDPRLAELRSSILSKSNYKDYQYNPQKIYHSLKKIENNKRLTAIDNSNSATEKINNTIRLLRNLRKRLNDEESTINEKNIVKNTNTLAKIDYSIKKLDSLYSKYEYEGDTSLEFSAVLNDLLTILDEFNIEKNENYNNDSIAWITNLYSRLDAVAERLWPQRNPASNELAKYLIMVDAIATSNSGDHGEILISLINNKQVARTIRCRAAAGLGLVGNTKDLATLLSLYPDADSEFKKSTLFAIGAILSGKQDPTAYNSYKTTPSHISFYP